MLLIGSLEVPAGGGSGEEGFLHLGPVALSPQTAGLRLVCRSAGRRGGALVLKTDRQTRYEQGMTWRVKESIVLRIVDFSIISLIFRQRNPNNFHWEYMVTTFPIHVRTKTTVIMGVAFQRKLVVSNVISTDGR